jgi:Domain of unknown function (DUF4124)
MGSWEGASMNYALVAIVLLSVPALVGAGTYKCQDASGRYTFTDQSCKPGEAVVGPAMTAPAAPQAQPVAPSAPSPVIGPRAEKPVPYKRPQPVVVPPLPNVDLSGPAKDAQGRPIMAQSGGAAIVLEKGKLRPTNVLAACSALVTRCYKPGEREMDACFMSAPACSSERPWDDPAGYKPCCPPQCWKQYEAKRIVGVSPMAAFDATLFGRGKQGNAGCIPLR